MHVCMYSSLVNAYHESSEVITNIHVRSTGRMQRIELQCYIGMTFRSWMHNSVFSGVQWAVLPLKEMRTFSMYSLKGLPLTLPLPPPGALYTHAHTCELSEYINYWTTVILSGLNDIQLLKPMRIRTSEVHITGTHCIQCFGFHALTNPHVIILVRTPVKKY